MEFKEEDFRLQRDLEGRFFLALRHDFFDKKEETKPVIIEKPKPIPKVDEKAILKDKLADALNTEQEAKRELLEMKLKQKKELQALKDKLALLVGEDASAMP